jgi:N-acetylglutamate synthase-like GNAT family acetyltransferase
MVTGEERVFVRSLQVKIRAALSTDMHFIRECIEKFRLDSEDIDYRQFVVSVDGTKINGFGRMRLHREIVELGSVGVVEGMRNQGIGTMIVKHLIDIFPTDEVFIATDIPRFFERLGFKIVDQGPEDLIEKIMGVCQSKGRGDSVIMLHEKGAALERG